MQNKNKKKRAFTIAETAVYVGVSETTVRNWIAADMIPYEELPGRGKGSYRFRLIRMVDIDDFLDKHYHDHKKERKQYQDDLILLPKESMTI